MESLPNRVALPEFSNWSASKAWQVLSTKKWPPVATTFPSGIQRHHWVIGIPGYTFESSILTRAIPPLLLGLCSPGDYRQSLKSLMDVPTFNSTDKALKFTIYDYILRLNPEKVWYFTKSIPLAAKFNYLATSAEYSGSINRPSAVKEVDECVIMRCAWE